jgi:hypothetical protein
MCNCGKKRMQYSQHPEKVQAKNDVSLQNSSYSTFEYTGKTALTIVGNITGIQYRFNYPGNKQNIDYRDVPGIRTIPVLKKVG